MNTFDPGIIIAVLFEVFGLWFWAVLLAATLGIALFVFALMRDRHLMGPRVFAALAAGITGGFAALGFTWWITRSSIADVGGAIDAILIVSIWFAGFFGTMILSYGVLSILNGPSQRRIGD